MLPYFTDKFANPSSNHGLGWLNKEVVNDSKSLISKIMGVKSDEIIFTSGSTEGINMIIKSLFFQNKNEKNHIITTKAEHKAVLDTCDWLSKNGASVTYLNTDNNGRIDLNELENQISDKTFLVSIILANNETGYIQPIKKIKAICYEKNIPLFSDATQAIGKIKLKNYIPFVDYACFSAHKFYGPKGIGFIYQNKKEFSSIKPFIHGGGQQEGLRGGTLNTPLIIGASKAFEKAIKNFDSVYLKIKDLKNRLEKGLLEIEGTKINCLGEERLMNTTNVSFDYVDGDQLINSLRTKIALSNGSACNSISVNPSHVLLAMGINPSLAFSSLRISLGQNNTKEEIDQTIRILKNELKKIREKNILWEN